MAMSQVIQEEPVDVCVVGLGPAGGIVATELAIAGFKVVGIEKGPYWNVTDDFSTTKYDEWGLGYLRKYDHPLPISSWTVRNNNTQFAIPQRSYQGIFLGMGHG